MHVTWSFTWITWMHVTWIIWMHVTKRATTDWDKRHDKRNNMRHDMRLVSCHLAPWQDTSDGVALVLCHATDATHVHVPPSNNIIRFVFSHHPHLACLDPVSVDLLRVDPLWEWSRDAWRKPTSFTSFNILYILWTFCHNYLQYLFHRHLTLI